MREGKRDGAWNRGYREWNGEMFIFANVGAGTTSGFDYPNALHPDGSLTWTGVGSSALVKGRSSRVRPDLPSPTTRARA